MDNNDSDFNEYDAYIASIAMMRKFRLDQNSEGIDRRLRSRRAAFTRKLRKVWGTALDAYFRAAVYATDLGRGLAPELQSELDSEEPHLALVMLRLHAQACLVAFEVWVLLAAGYAQGALTRWRTLHEIATTMLFLHDHGEDVALRFWIHGGIQRRRLAKELESTDLEPLRGEAVEEINADREGLISRFGKNFDDTYGWAAAALGKERNKRGPTFRDIEESLDLLPSDTRWIYKWATTYVHPQAMSTAISLGLPALHPGSLAGPSVLGLDWPGHAAMLSLQHCTVALATLRQDGEREIRIKLLTHLIEEASSAFKTAARPSRRNQPAPRNEGRDEDA
jgi:hypothetical protein